MKKSASQTHVQRYKNIKKRVQRQMLDPQPKIVQQKPQERDDSNGLGPLDLPNSALSNPMINTQMSKTGETNFGGMPAYL
jgi:hypothetical protein